MQQEGPSKSTADHLPSNSHSHSPFPTSLIPLSLWAPRPSSSLAWAGLLLWRARISLLLSFLLPRSFFLRRAPWDPPRAAEARGRPPRGRRRPPHAGRSNLGGRRRLSEAPALLSRFHRYSGGPLIEREHCASAAQCRSNLRKLA